MRYLVESTARRTFYFFYKKVSALGTKHGFFRRLCRFGGGISAFFCGFGNDFPVCDLLLQTFQAAPCYVDTECTDEHQSPSRQVFFRRSVLYPNLARLFLGLTCFFLGSWCTYTADWGWTWRGTWGLVFLLVGCALCFGPIPWCGCDGNPCLFRFW